MEESLRAVVSDHLHELTATGCGGRGTPLVLGGLTCERRGADKVTGRFCLSRLRFQGAVVDPLLAPGSGQRLVGQRRDFSSEPKDFVGSSFRFVQHPRFSAETLGGQYACGEQQVDVVVATIAGMVRRMDGKLDRHLIPVHKDLGQLACQGKAVLAAQFVRKSYDELSRQSRIGARLALFDGLPQLVEIVRPCRGI